MRAIVVAVVAAFLIPSAPALGRTDPSSRTGPCSAACHARVKQRVLAHRRYEARKRMLAYVRPYTAWLEKTGACESGTGSYDLSVGLQAVSPGGKYRGRYQFDLDSWARAGGHGDPIDADWLTQAVIAVNWLRKVGNGAWPICGH